MTPKRISVGLLSLGLLALLGWNLARGVGDVRTQVMLGAGSCLGVLYTLFGRLPDWLIEHSGGSLVADDNRGNISLRVYEKKGKGRPFFWGGGGERGVPFLFCVLLR